MDHGCLENLAAIHLTDNSWSIIGLREMSGMDAMPFVCVANVWRSSVRVL